MATQAGNVNFFLVVKMHIIFITLMEFTAVNNTDGIISGDSFHAWTMQAIEHII